jgi:arginase
VDVGLIKVPYHAGDERLGSSEGPERLLEAGAEELLRARGVGVSVESVERGAAFRDTATSAARVNKKLAEVVARTVDAERLPVVLAGSCNSAMGVLAGFEHSRCGAVWLDAHADFNTPESTTSGFFPGMSVAVITGHCFRNYWAQIGDNTPLKEEAVAMFGVRDLSPDAERERLKRSAIRVVCWQDGKPQSNVLGALDELAGHVEEVYLHVDFDGFSPQVAPGVVDETPSGGLSVEDGEMIIRAAARRFRIRAATLATYTPESDENLKTQRLGLSLIDLLGEYAALASRSADFRSSG